jgi:hypothetical protein
MAWYRDNFTFYCLGEMETNGKILLKEILKEKNMRFWNLFNFLTSGRIVNTIINPWAT